MGYRASISSWNVLIAGLLALAVAAMIALVLLIDPFGRGGSGLAKPFVLDLDALRRYDPNLLLYVEAPHRRVATGFTEVRGIALDAGANLYVAGDRAIMVYDAAGKPLRSFPTGEPARCLAVASDGTVYVGIGDHVEVYSPTGQRMQVWQADRDESLVTCITLHEDQVLAGFYRKREGYVVRYDRTGKRLNFIEPPKDGGRKLLAPSPHLDLVVADGYVRIANPGALCVEGYSLDGEPQPSLNWGGPSGTDIAGFVPCCNPTDLAALPEGGFVTSEKGVPRVKVYNAAGRFQGLVAGSDSFAADAAGLDLAVDAEGRIFVLDPPAKAVRVFVRKKEPEQGSERSVQPTTQPAGVSTGYCP